MTLLPVAGITHVYLRLSFKITRSASMNSCIDPEQITAAEMDSPVEGKQTRSFRSWRHWRDCGLRSANRYRRIRWWCTGHSTLDRIRWWLCCFGILRWQVMRMLVRIWCLSGPRGCCCNRLRSHYVGEIIGNKWVKVVF